MYEVGDAREISDYVDGAVAAVADLAWHRPGRNDQLGVEYPTYSTEDGIWDFIDEIYKVLDEGGWAFFDADDWFLPRLIRYLQQEWGDVASTYRGGGYRKVGTVVYTDGNLGSGHYFTNAGYHVVMAHKGETDRMSKAPAKVATERPEFSLRQEVDWGTIKPIEPYRIWLDEVTEKGEMVVIPCAGTAPAAIALEIIYGDEANFFAIDSEVEAKSSYERRRELELEIAKDVMEW